MFTTSMFTTKFRIVMVASLLLFMAVIVSYVKNAYSFTVVLPSPSLDSAPQRIGFWQGEQFEIDEDELQVLDAQDIASLKFTAPGGQVAFVHMASWTDIDTLMDNCPHRPSVCYPAAGWMIIETKSIDLDGGVAGEIPIEVNLMERDGQRIVVGHTYEMGKHRFLTAAAAHAAQAQFWGQPEWPAMTKYLVQSHESSIEAAMPHIRKLMAEIVAWRSGKVSDWSSEASVEPSPSTDL